MMVKQCFTHIIVPRKVTDACKRIFVCGSAASIAEKRINWIFVLYKARSYGQQHPTKYASFKQKLFCKSVHSFGPLFYLFLICIRSINLIIRLQFPLNECIYISIYRYTIHWYIIHRDFFFAHFVEMFIRYINGNKLWKRVYLVKDTNIFIHKSRIGQHSVSMAY